MQTGHHLLKLPSVARSNGVDVVGQQAELRAQRRLDSADVAERRGKIVNVDGRQCAVTVVLGAQRPPAAVLLEPNDRGTEDAAITQVVAHPRLNDAEVLTDDDGAGALGFQKDNAHHGLVIVVHVGALGGRTAIRNPPEAEHTEDVVDSHGTGVSQGGSDHVA